MKGKKGAMTVPSKMEGKKGTATVPPKDGGQVFCGFARGLLPSVVAIVRSVV